MIWLVGRNGMLGTELARALSSHGWRWVGTDREVSITDTEALIRFSWGKGLNWIVNCAAYTAVDKAEAEPILAAAINAEGPANLALAATACGARLLHISTDYVFPGDANRPYVEEDRVGAQSVYGRTKAQGEENVRRLAEQAVILRSAWLYGLYGPNFVYTMLRLMRRREEIGVVSDQIGSPTWTADLVRVILTILEAKEPILGTYHFASDGITNWHEFAVEILQEGTALGILEHHCTVRSLSTSDYPAAARRPAYSVLSKEKIVRDYAVEVPHWRQSIKRFLKDVADGFADDHRRDANTEWDPWLDAKCRIHPA